MKYILMHQDVLLKRTLDRSASKKADLVSANDCGGVQGDGDVPGVDGTLPPRHLTAAWPPQ
jgi:hypothetical protein